MSFPCRFPSIQKCWQRAVRPQAPRTKSGLPVPPTLNVYITTILSHCKRSWPGRSAALGLAHSITERTLWSPRYGAQHFYGPLQAMRIPYVPSCTHDLQAQNHDHRRRRVVASSSCTFACMGHDYPPSFPLLHVLRVVSMHKSMNLDDTTTSPHQRHRVDLLHARHIYTATQECAFTAAPYGPPNEPDAAAELQL